MRTSSAARALAPTQQLTAHNRPCCSYISAYSTSLPLGVEWISDDRLVVVFPSKLSAASALNSLLADPTSPAVLADLSMTTPAATSTAFDATLPTVEGQSVPTHLWPVALRQVATRLRMDADEGGAPDPSDGGVMKERLGIRWAREGDKKAGRKVHLDPLDLTLLPAPAARKDDVG